MKIRAVIDVKDRLAVRAIAGQRSHYRPLEYDGKPLNSVALAKRIADRTGIRDLYLADLDAIGGKAADWEAIRQIAATSGSLWFDTGIGSPEQLEVVAEHLDSLPPATVAIMGLESLLDVRFLVRALDAFGADQICFSLDLHAGKPVTGITGWRELSPVDIAMEVIEQGVRKMIVLDLAAVGTGAGCPTVGLCETIRQRSQSILPPGESLEIVTGGGIRGMDDVRQLENAKVDQALVATALEQVTLGTHE